MNINNFLVEINYELNEIEYSYKAIANSPVIHKQEARSLLKRLNSIQDSICNLTDTVDLRSNHKYVSTALKLVSLKHNIIELTI